MKPHPLGVKVVRCGEALTDERILIDTPEKCLQHWLEHVAKEGWYDTEKEQCVVLLLNTRYGIKGHALVSLGSLNESIVHPREVFRPAVVMGAYCIVVMHNHPTGDPSPSQADHSLTRRLREAGEILGVKLLDHVIVGGAAGVRYYSFKEHGVL